MINCDPFMPSVIATYARKRLRFETSVPPTDPSKQRRVFKFQSTDDVADRIRTP